MKLQARGACAMVGLFSAAIAWSSFAIAQTPLELPKGLAPSGAPPTAPASPDTAQPKRSPPTPPPTAPAPTLPDGTLAVPPLARVTDTAGVLDAAARAQLEAKLAAFEQSRGAQIAVIVVPSTQPEPIADFANRVGGVWKIGRAGVGDGVLIAVAVKDASGLDQRRASARGVHCRTSLQRASRANKWSPICKAILRRYQRRLRRVMRRVEGEGLPTRPDSSRPWSRRRKRDVVRLPLIIGLAHLQRAVAAQARCAGRRTGWLRCGAIAGFILSSLLLGGVARDAVFLFSAFGGLGGGGRGGRA